MASQKWERAIELTIVGIVLFVGLVSILYSWIDSAFGGNINIYLLTTISAAVTFLIVYAISAFDKG